MNWRSESNARALAEGRATTAVYIFGPIVFALGGCATTPAARVIEIQEPETRCVKTQTTPDLYRCYEVHSVPPPAPGQEVTR